MEKSKSFKDIDEQILPTYYTSDENKEEDKSHKTFLIPLLKRSKEYKRETFGLSSAILSLMGDSINEIIKNDCKVYYIVGLSSSDGSGITPEDVGAIRDGLEDDFGFYEKQILREFGTIENLIKRLNSRNARKRQNHRLAMLRFLVSKKIINIKIGYKRRSGRSNGIFHTKVSIFRDFDNNTIVSTGSPNESMGGHINNEESFNVFKSWDEGAKSWHDPHLKKFEEYWDNKCPDVRTIDINKLIEKKILKDYKVDFKSKEEMIEIDERLSELIREEEENSKNKTVDEIDFLWSYQKEAVSNWLKTKYGIFVMATGTGKTYAALGCAHHIVNQKEKVGIIIVTPQNTITTQWMDSLNKFNLEGSEVSGCAKKELSVLANGIVDLKLDNKNYFLIGTTYNTFYQEEFINELNKFDGKLMIIADEVHNAGTKFYRKGLLEKYVYRLGLSATPERAFDKEGSLMIYDYFYKGKFDSRIGDTYSLEISKAIKTINPSTGKTFLVPYEYYFHICELSETEFKKFEEYSKKISRLSAILEQDKRSDKKGLNTLLNKRKEILKSATGKISLCGKIIDKNLPLKKTLFFLDTNEQIKKLTDLVDKKHPTIVYRVFTSKSFKGKKKNKKLILEDFKEGHFDTLFSIDCFTEGVDVPSVERAVIVASSTNPKEFVQRRGRVLRRHKEKEKAQIIDILVFPPKGKDPVMSEKLVRSEVRRCKIFAKDALNSEKIEKLLKSTIDEYGIIEEKVSEESKE